MKYIVDIPEKVVTAIQNGEDYRYDIHTAIAQGIPYEERPQGEWLCVTKSTFPQYQPDEYKCPFCNTIVHRKTNYCEYCGAEMRKGGAE